MFRGKNGEYSEDQKILMNTTDIEKSEPEVSDVNTPLSDIEDEVDESDKSTGFQFAANLMKSITGSTSLIFPFTIWKMGLVTGTLFTLYTVYIYATTTWRLLQVYNHYKGEQKIEKDPRYNLDNDYTVLCYKCFGTFGYWLMLLSTLITLWGSDMGTMVLMTDLLVSLPWFNSFSENETTRRLVATIILFILCWLTCIFKNPTLLAGISSLGLIALIVAFVAALIYGGITFGLSWDSSVLWPLSFKDVLSTLGIVINAFGFMLLLFPLYNEMKEAYKPKVGRYVNFGVITIGLLYLIPGIILFLMYRSDPNGIHGAILMNLPQDSLYYIIIAITMLITLWGSYPLLLLPCFQILETNKRLIFYIAFNWLAHRDGKFFVKDAYRFWTRTIQVVLLTVLGFYIPIFSSINAINILEFK
ncbi:uncharacterized protein [Blastocystis hominis]|uniref:Amino acid transporter transmembrane domain-containing protein n=1 Tax=Blastocystis hominis TaxID=12968 RepID=D8M1H9_BLAHO|nr:uncharacterized protein [Blastocystis hominis]CBK21918.2 unnamed protein product [Blastocystis hominis]|eukprot:XP_012895966.1 uncharacterized protein [Blastocystis hominis]